MYALCLFQLLVTVMTSYLMILRTVFVRHGDASGACITRPRCRKISRC